METKSKLWNLACNCFRRAQSLGSCAGSKGQALVEFTLVFILLLIVAWIPADFGLAFYTGQLALNGSREGARIAAADPCLLGINASAGCAIGGSVDQTGSCILPCSGVPAGSILAETAERVSSALLPGAQISVALSGTGCSKMVTVSISGFYNFFYYKVFRIFGANVRDDVNIVRSTRMRWEHQSSCG